MQHIDRFKGNLVTLKERIGQLSMAVANMYGSDRSAVMVRFESMHALVQVSMRLSPAFPNYCSDADLNSTQALKASEPRFRVVLGSLSI